MSSFWGKKTFCCVTGASRGIGKTLSVEFSKNVGNGSVFLLLARSTSALEETKKEILTSAPGVEVVTVTIDLTSPSAQQYFNIIKGALDETGSSSSSFEHSILVHNAGSLGNIQLKVTQVENINEITEYFSFNLFSLIILTSQFYKIFNDSSKKRTMIQITSLGALTPFKTWGYYCAGKAARDSLLRSVAIEDPSIETVNYSPGPVETDIYSEAVSNTGDPEVKKLFEESRTSGSVLSPIQTIKKLLKMLDEGKYTKGEHVDYFDLP